jgi:ABC-type lipoprotein release transport system permease subunit
VSFVGQAADGSIAAELFSVHGLVRSGADEMDANMAFIRLSDAQELLSLGERVHRVVAVFHDRRDIALPTVGIGATAMAWEELMPDMASAIESDRGGLRVFLIVLLIMVVLGVANTLMMSVFERTREYGLMLALGASAGHVLAITVYEAVWLCLIGVGGGVVMGDLLTVYLPMSLPEPMEFGGIVMQHMQGAINIQSTLIFPLMVFVAGVLASLPPAIRAARLSPVEALRRGA